MAFSRFDPLFNPESIAVLGASEAEGAVGTTLFNNLVDGGYKGLLVPVNPKYKEVRGLKCYKSILDVEQHIDLAVIATPAATVPGIIRDCGQHGTRFAVIISAGFGESGPEGEKLEARLIEAARDADVRFIGPNCVGLVRPHDAMDASFLRTRTPKGRLALVSQSGAMCAAIADWAGPHNLGFSALISVGNGTNIDFGDALKFLSIDPTTDAILLYVEGIRNARSFVSGLRAAARLKPVIVLKSGRHKQGLKAAQTHSAALVGSDDAFEAALELAGAVRVESFGQLFAAAEILSASNRSSGGRLGIITNGGGAGVLAADRAGSLNIELPAPSEKTLATLNAILSPNWSHANPIDILGDAPPPSYGAAVQACIEDPSFDGVLVMLTPQAMTQPTDAARAVVEAIPQNTRKPVFACWMGETSVAEARRILSESGIPNFQTPERAVEAFSYLAQRERNRQLLQELPEPLSDVEAPDVEGVRLILRGVMAEGRQMLSSIEAKAILSAFRVPINTVIEASTPVKALIAAETVGFPVVMKIDSPHITHKSDVGGVHTNVATADHVAMEFNEIVSNAKAARPDAEIHGVTIEHMANIEHARELMVGATRDPVFGPTILFGAGGTMVEILSDSAVSLPPLSVTLAKRLISRTRVAHLLDAFRDRPAVDQREVINVLMRVSDLLCEFPEIEELDINPLLGGPDGVIAVDARIKIGRKPTTVVRYDHMAISPYPRHLVQTDILTDGTKLTIRPIRPEDAESEQNFVRDLSAEAKQFRFMHAIRELTPEMLVRFTQIDYGNEMALIATTPDPHDRTQEKQQGVARYVINPDETSCEFAIVVSDERRHQGIGTRLMNALMNAARLHGLRQINGAVLANNGAMMKLMAELGFAKTRSKDEPDIFLVSRQL